MVSLIIEGLRFALLLILYWFLYRVARAIYLDIRTARPTETRAGQGWSLVVIDGPGWVKGQQFELTQPTIRVGRAPDNDIVINDPLVSRTHLSIVQGSRGFLLRDYNSKNGTWVNGHRVMESQWLGEGDVIKLGSTVLQLSGGRHETRSRVPHRVGAAD
ncbi:MAG: FHA domain-containing protein [Clostridia bacterium]|nr:FHA domain-containing protein [Clostridia bacterium]